MQHIRRFQRSLSDSVKIVGTVRAVPRLALGGLRAIDASTLKELWNSDLDNRDRLPAVAKFTPVTVANGKVYVPTFSNKLVVYGLKP